MTSCPSCHYPAVEWATKCTFCEHEWKMSDKDFDRLKTAIIEANAYLNYLQMVFARQTGRRMMGG